MNNQILAIERLEKKVKTLKTKNTKLHGDVVKLQEQLAKARSDALEAVEAERKDAEKLCVEVLAMEIYASWKHQDGYVPWVVKGNSLKQGDARAIARRRIDAAIAAEGK